MVARARSWLTGLAAALVAGLVWVYGATHPGLVRSVVAPGPLSRAHAFLDASCTSCHTPGSGVRRSSCLGCHATEARLLGRQPTAFHASVASCAGCHVEHDRTRARPIAMDHALLASLGTSPFRDTTLAPDTAATKAMSDTLPAPRGPPAAWRAGLAFPLLRPGEERLDCASCHSTKDPHRELFGRDCASCHATAAWTIPGYRHPSPRSVNCVQCHQAPPSHYMMHFEMVSKAVARRSEATVAQCFSCHQTTSWNDIIGVGWYKHH